MFDHDKKRDVVSHTYAWATQERTLVHRHFQQLQNLEFTMSCPIHFASHQDYLDELRRRCDLERQIKELHVDYHRIGYRLAFPLPLFAAPLRWPEGIPGWRDYPWLTWLSQALAERWSTLLAARRWLEDNEAEAVLASEIRALAAWPNFHGTNGQACLVTSHLADVVAHVIEQTRGYLASVAEGVGIRLLREVLSPWYKQRSVSKKPWPPIHNLESILLLSASRLANACSWHGANGLNLEATQWLHHWTDLRIQQRHTEGLSYDGFLWQSVMGWLNEHPDRPALLNRCRPAMRSVLESYVWLHAPGNVLALCPIGDVEPQMRFWISAVARMSAALDDSAGRWLLTQIPLAEQPVDALVSALTHQGTSQCAALTPGDRCLPLGWALRTGWEADDALVTVAVSHIQTNHLHTDTGSLLIGWRRRFWITDPGYQQYRPGVARDFTIGPDAHNHPRLDGMACGTSCGKPLETHRQESPSCVRFGLDLSAALEQSASGTMIHRDVTCTQQGRALDVIEVVDSVNAAGVGRWLHTTWLIDAGLAVSFIDGWVRLSDGQAVMWIGRDTVNLGPDALTQHEGSTGPVCLRVVEPVDPARFASGWRFVLQAYGGFEAPASKPTGT